MKVLAISILCCLPLGSFAATIATVSLPSSGTYIVTVTANVSCNPNNYSLSTTFYSKEDTKITAEVNYIGDDLVRPTVCQSGQNIATGLVRTSQAATLTVASTLISEPQFKDNVQVQVEEVTKTRNIKPQE